MLFLLQQVAHFCLQLAHLGVEVYLLVAVAELDVFAWDKAPAFLLDFVKAGRVAVFGFVVIGLFITFTLPVMEVLGYLLYLLLRELDVLLLERLTPLAQVDKQHFILAIAIADKFAVLLYVAGFLVVVQDPKRHADVRGVEHIARQDDNSLHYLI